MIQIPDHPVIRSCERTGYPPEVNYITLDEDDQIDEEDDQIEPEDS